MKLQKHSFPLVLAIVSLAAAQCKTDAECVDVSGLWMNGSSCFMDATVHVSQDGCDIFIEEEPSFDAWVRQDEVYIRTNAGLRCKGVVGEPLDGLQTIEGTCEDEGGMTLCSWSYERGESSDECPSGSLVREEIQVQGFVGVDILVVVDNSGSMAAEQAMLRDAFPGLITSILNPPIDPDTGKRAHAPVRDLHIGVVSTDMGVGGYDVQTCDEPIVGDDGILQHTPRGADCAPSYPTFMSYQIGETEEPNIDMVNSMSQDFGCIAVLGTRGCGFEQQLEAAWKALMIHSQTGGANAGFLRQDTILAILFVTDEEDCSPQDMTFFNITSLPYSASLQCYYQKDKLHSIDRYYNDLSSLREHPDNLVLGFIVGVPPGDPMCEGRGNEIGGCLAAAAMQETVRPDGELLEYSCKYPTDCTPPDPPDSGNCSSEAFPAIRYVQLAQQFGNNAVVQSICTNSFEPAVAALTEKLKEAIIAQRFKRRLPAEKDPEDPSGCRCIAPCSLIETLSDNRPCESLGNPAKTTLLDEHGTPVLEVDEDTGRVHTLCLVQQAGAVISDCFLECDDPMAAYVQDPGRQGWWYDPSTDLDGDAVPDPQVLFTGVEPESGSTLTIECCM